MNAEEKYNAIIRLIEECTTDEDGCYTPSEIAEKVSQESGMNVRDLGSIFNFLTGRSLITYIKERQLMYAYKHLVDGESMRIGLAVTYTSFGDQSAFSRAFKRLFGMTPGEAFDRREENLFQPPLTWDRLTKPEGFCFEDEEFEEMQPKIFGLDTDVYKAVTEATDYKNLYGFSQAQSEAAFALYQRYKDQDVELKQAFEFIDAFSNLFYIDADDLEDEDEDDLEDEDDFEDEDAAEDEDEAEEAGHELRAEWFTRLVLDYEWMFVLFLNVEATPLESLELKRELAVMGLDVKKMPTIYVDFYFEGLATHLQFPEIYRFAREHEDEIHDMWMFLQEACSFGPEMALDLDAAFNDKEEMARTIEIVMEDMEKEKQPGYVPDYWPEEDTVYWDPRDRKIDYDVDNMAYEEDDMNPGFFD